MNTTPKDPVPDVDPLDILTEEQKTSLGSEVAENLNAFVRSNRSNATRPLGSGWSGHGVFDANKSNPLFARMAWEIVNKNFESQLSNQDPLFVNRVYTYLCEFGTHRAAGFDTLSRTDLWIKQGRKNLVGYLLKIFPTYDTTDDDKAETFFTLAARAIADVTFWDTGVDKRQDYRAWRQDMDTSIIKANAKLQQISESI